MDAGKISRNLAVANGRASQPFQEEAFAAAKRWGAVSLPEARNEIFDRKAKDNAVLFSNNIESFAFLSKILHFMSCFQLFRGAVPMLSRCSMIM